MEWWEHIGFEPDGSNPSSKQSVFTAPFLTVSAKQDPVATHPSEIPRELPEGVKTPPPSAPFTTISEKQDKVAMHPSPVPGFIRTASAPEPRAATEEKPSDPPKPPDLKTAESVQSLKGFFGEIGHPMQLASSFPIAARSSDPMPAGLPGVAGLPQPKPEPVRKQAATVKPPTPKPTPEDKPMLRAVTTKATQAMPKLTPMLSKTESGYRAVVSIPDKKVVVYNKAGDVIKEYSVFVGKAKTPTPRGSFRIMDNIKPAKSDWYYGPRWMTFATGPGSTKDAIAKYGFHGWVYDKDDDEMERTDPGWKTSTHGCVQMLNKEVEEFSKLMGVGSEVTILDTPIAPPVPKPKMPEMKTVNPISSVFGGA